LLAEPHYAARARELARWSRDHDAGQQAARALESFAVRSANP
jgi:hypothetical protein